MYHQIQNASGLQAGADSGLVFLCFTRTYKHMTEVRQSQSFEVFHIFGWAWMEVGKNK